MPEPFATGTILNRDDAVCRALRFLLLKEARRVYPVGNAADEPSAPEIMSLYEELGGTTEE